MYGVCIFVCMYVFMYVHVCKYVILKKSSDSEKKKKMDSWGNREFHHMSNEKIRLKQSADSPD